MFFLLVWKMQSIVNKGLTYSNEQACSAYCCLPLNARRAEAVAEEENMLPGNVWLKRH
jgi:hypothetical protein